MRLLLAVDGSACAARAAAEVATRAGDWREAPEIHLVYVHPPIPIGGVQAHISHDKLDSYYRDESLPHLAEAERILAGLAFTRHIHVGEPAEVIARLAGELACDWIVVGNHGRSAAANALLGSVAQRLLQLAHCPVLLVK